jgi:hypothetical protein
MLPGQENGSLGCISKCEVLLHLLCFEHSTARLTQERLRGRCPLRRHARGGEWKRTKVLRCSSVDDGSGLLCTVRRSLPIVPFKEKKMRVRREVDVELTVPNRRVRKSNSQTGAPLTTFQCAWCQRKAPNPRPECFL